MHLVCLGECLAPAIRNGTVIEAESVAPDRIRCGELVVFSLRGVYACHRVLFKKFEEGLWWFFLKADNTGVPDGWMPHYRIVGTVTRIGGELRPTPATQRDDRYRMWKSRLGYSIYRVRRLFQSLATQRRPRHA